MENKSRITVIIPFLEEEDEIYHTVKNIRDTSADEVDILLVNDASSAGYDYRSVAGQFGATYVEHTERCGVAFSRDEAIGRCETEFFLLLDGHMRFTRKDWSQKLLRALQSDRRCIWCCQTKAFFKDEKGEIVRPERRTTYGAYIDFRKKQWAVHWNYEDPSPGCDITEVPLILGAAYACNKTYWQRLGGLEGLKIYGLDEQLISMKAWLEGGSCKLLKELVVEHLYRKSFPYVMDNYYLIYNSLLLTELFLPEQLKEEFIDEIIKIYSRSAVIKAMEALTAQEEWIERRKEAYRQWRSVPVEQVIERHNLIKNRNVSAENK